MKTIQLYKTVNGWMSYEDDAERLELFGTKHLPTAFTAAASADKVVARIKELNPGYVVKVVEGINQ